jgi:hypothetical protein
MADVDETKRPDDAETQAPSTVDQQPPSVAEDHAPSTGEPVTTDIPTANAPDPTAVNAEDNPNAAKPRTGKTGAKTSKAAATSEEAVKPAKAKEAADGETAKPAAKAKKEKAPSVEDKPFTEFIQQDYIPALKQGLEKFGTRQLELKFEKRLIPIKGYNQECWQVVGRWDPSYKQHREFNIYFFDENINGLKGFACAEGDRLSTMESFLIDERKVTLDLLVFGAVQRLNGQKWLARN